MSRRSTLDKPLGVAADAADAHSDLLDLSHLLQQLWHHHVSMAKPQSTPCSKEYNLELADRLAFHLGYRERAPELKFKPGGREKNELGKTSDALKLQELVTTSHVRDTLKPWLVHDDKCPVRKRRAISLSPATEAKHCTCGLMKAMGVEVANGQG